MDESDGLSIQRKALTLNKDLTRYGTFAEIGAGQEVARWFFRVGGAAGTVAKTMSAYDMVFSDAIYGASAQYVSRQRLNRMLDHEYELLVERLSQKRGSNTQFFVYANTVKAKGYKGNDDCHGWMGVRFQKTPNGPANQIIIHVWMHDKSAVLQQEAIGIVGVNLVYASVYDYNPQQHVVSLLDDLDRDRIEVDMIEFSGPDFKDLNNQAINLELVRHKLTSSVVFTPDRSIHQASEILYKRPIIIERGKFRPVTKINLEMLDAGRKQFLTDISRNDEQPIEIMEISLQNLLGQDEFDSNDYLARIDILNQLGKTVMVSNRSEFHKLASHLRRNTKKKIGIILGVPLLKEIFDEKYYSDLEGGLLEGFGRLFKRDITLYVYPVHVPSMNEIITARGMTVHPKLGNLLEYLLDNHNLVEITTAHSIHTVSSSQEVIEKISQHDSSWEEMVLPEVAETIKSKRYFGYSG
jgi:hypothetical protein